MESIIVLPGEGLLYTRSPALACLPTEHLHALGYPSRGALVAKSHGRSELRGQSSAPCVHIHTAAGCEGRRRKE